jgi:hypothetical protein
MSLGTLKEVIRSVAQEEDRRNNVIIFGVQEQEPDNLREFVKDVFDEMRVRPETLMEQVSFLSQGKNL